MYKNIIFDLDGTIMDSNIGIINSLRYALRAMGLEPDTLGDLSRFIGPPLYDTFKDAAGLAPQKAEEAVGKYREYYMQKGIFEAAPYPGAANMLAALQASGRRLFLGTSKEKSQAERVLNKFALTPYFHFVGGASWDGSRRSKTEVLRYLLAENPGVEEKAIMVGDTVYDVEGALAVGLDTAAVLYGYGSRWSLEKAGAKYFFDSISALQSWLLEGSPG